MKDLNQFKKEFDVEINNYLDTEIEEAGRIDKKAKDLLGVIKEFINNGGKRLRPAIFYYSYISYSSKYLNKILKFSLVFELFQTFALIHDDIIDKSALRRGCATVYKKYGIETAILAGDMALMMADELFFNLLVKKPVIKELYNKLKQETVIGQYLDLIKLEEPEKIMDLKTAQYSFVKPALMGMYLANTDEQEIKKWEEILRQIGILFQIKDDFDGIFGNEKKTGKPTDSDIKEGKSTLLVKKFLQKASHQEKTRFCSFYGQQKVGKQDLIWFKKKLIQKGIVNDIKKLIKNESDEIKKKLNRQFSGLDITNLIDKTLIKINI